MTCLICCKWRYAVVLFCITECRNKVKSLLTGRFTLARASNKFHFIFCTGPKTISGLTSEAQECIQLFFRPKRDRGNKIHINILIFKCSFIFADYLNKLTQIIQRVSFPHNVDRSIPQSRLNNGNDLQVNKMEVWKIHLPTL